MDIERTHIGYCGICNEDLYSDQPRATRGTTVHLACSPGSTPLTARKPSVLDQHDIGCAVADGIACDCK